MSLADDLYLIAEPIGDDQPNLPEGSKNTLLLAAKALRCMEDWAIAESHVRLLQDNLDEAYDNEWCSLAVYLKAERYNAIRHAIEVREIAKQAASQSTGSKI